MGISTINLPFPVQPETFRRLALRRAPRAEGLRRASVAGAHLTEEPDRAKRHKRSVGFAFQVVPVILRRTQRAGPQWHTRTAGAPAGSRGNSPAAEGQPAAPGGPGRGSLGWPSDGETLSASPAEGLGGGVSGPGILPADLHGKVRRLTLSSQTLTSGQKVHWWETENAGRLDGKDVPDARQGAEAAPRARGHTRAHAGTRGHTRAHTDTRGRTQTHADTLSSEPSSESGGFGAPGMPALKDPTLL